VAWRIAVVKVMRKSGAARERGHSNPSPPKGKLLSFEMLRPRASELQRNEGSTRRNFIMLKAR
jgi:hypothetical protein